MVYFFDPFGCAKNQVDAEIMMDRLNETGWRGTTDPSGADLIIVNSCGFIEAAKRESINAVLFWKKQYPEKKILLAGCLTQRYRTELEEDLSEADGFLGCAELEMAAEKAVELFRASHIKKPIKTESSPGLRPLLGFPGSAYVKVSEGCNNRCSFCAIPIIRGSLHCRPIPDIVEECRQLLGRGVKELCLIGQDLASYDSLVSLLEAIAVLSGDFWVRLLYLHPDHFPPDILKVLETDNRFLPYFDIPFQHASPRLLSLMGRNGSGKSYIRLLDSIRSRLPDAVIRSTFLVGFPGETEEDFNMLLDFQEQACFDWLGVFCWSREEGTSAYSMKGRISKKTAARRKAITEERQIPITEKKMDRFVGRTMDVLIEEEFTETPAPNDGPQSVRRELAHPEKNTGLWLGRVFCQAPEVDGATVVQMAVPAEVASAAGGTSPVPGAMIRGTVNARKGFDFEVRVQ